MKKISPFIPPAGIIIVFFLMALACATPQRNTTRYTKPKPRPCVIHAPVYYSPVLVKINLSGNYTMKDLQTAQREGPLLIMDGLNSNSAGKFVLADGVTPNLTVNVTVNTDSYGHYGASVWSYVFDGNFLSTFDTNYISGDKLLSDIGKHVGSLIVTGWCNDCPSPCITH